MLTDTSILVIELHKCCFYLQSVSTLQILSLGSKAKELGESKDIFILCNLFFSFFFSFSFLVFCVSLSLFLGLLVGLLSDDSTKVFRFFAFIFDVLFLNLVKYTFCNQQPLNIISMRFYTHMEFKKYTILKEYHIFLERVPFFLKLAVFNTLRC